MREILVFFLCLLLPHSCFGQTSSCSSDQKCKLNGSIEVCFPGSLTSGPCQFTVCKDAKDRIPCQVPGAAFPLRYCLPTQMVTGLLSFECVPNWCHSTPDHKRVPCKYENTMLCMPEAVHRGIGKNGWCVHADCRVADEGRVPIKLNYATAKPICIDADWLDDGDVDQNFKFRDCVAPNQVNCGQKYGNTVCSADIVAYKPDGVGCTFIECLDQPGTYPCDVKSTTTCTPISIIASAAMSLRKKTCEIKATDACSNLTNQVACYRSDGGVSCVDYGILEKILSIPGDTTQEKFDCMDACQQLGYLKCNGTCVKNDDIATIDADGNCKLREDQGSNVCLFIGIIVGVGLVLCVIMLIVCILLICCYKKNRGPFKKKKQDKAAKPPDGQLWADDPNEKRTVRLY